MKRRKIRKKAVILLVVITLLLSYSGLTVVKNITGQLEQLAQAKATAMVKSIVNETLTEVLANSIEYSDLVTTIKSADGSITYIQANSIRMNDLAYSVAQLVQSKLEKEEDMGINIKLGAVLGSDLLSNSGPNITVKIRLVGNASAEMASEFESSGINQTRHKIILVVKSSMKIILPSSHADVDIDTRVSLFEGIIVGKVPDYYLNAPADEPYLNLVPGA